MIIKELDLKALEPFIPSKMQVEGKAYRCIVYHFVDRLSVRAAALQVGFTSQCGHQACNLVYGNIADAGYRWVNAIAK